MTLKYNLCSFVKTIHHGGSMALFCLLGLWNIRKNRKNNPPNQIRHRNKRGPGGLLDFSILYSVFCPTTRNDLTRNDAKQNTKYKSKKKNVLCILHYFVFCTTTRIYRFIPHISVHSLWSAKTKYKIGVFVDFVSLYHTLW